MMRFIFDIMTVLLPVELDVLLLAYLFLTHRLDWGQA
jgi:hypothetical protein